MCGQLSLYLWVEGDGPIVPIRQSDSSEQRVPVHHDHNIRLTALFQACTSADAAAGWTI